MVDDDDFFDTVSVTSKKSNNRATGDYLSLSRQTVYHSAIDLDNAMELTPLDDFDSGNHQNKVSKDVKTYKQWRERKWHYFTKSDHRVDYVLAYDKRNKAGDDLKRNHFEAKLIEKGLLIEREENQRIHFIKIHVPREVLCCYAEILKLRLPIRTEDGKAADKNILSSTFNWCLLACRVRLDPKLFAEEEYTLTAEFNREKNYLFDVDKPDFFNEGTRIAIASYILENEKYGPEDQETGIKRLLSENVYKAAYPLHDGDLQDKDSKRHLLFKHWAQVSHFIKYQPIDTIKDYFGVKMALYFAWLGFYTHMLIPAAIVGILCLIYAAFTLNSDKISRDICTLDIIMCPRCDKYCNYWRLNETCTYAKIQHFIDNPATIFFAVFMSFWSILYLELWKRYSAEIAHRWGLTGFDAQAEPARPEYLIRLANATKQKVNPVTGKREPGVSFWRVRLPTMVLSFSLVLVWIFITMAVVMSVVIYRMALVTSQALYGDKQSIRVYVVPVTSALINLAGIWILNFFYNKLAVWLTELELQRSQTEYEDSLTLKIYMFQFVNYYSSIFYIAFLKGKFVGYPAKYNKVFGFRQEECNPGGCLMELTIQLAIIMIGNQAIGALLEMVMPLVYNMYNTFKVSTGIEKARQNEEEVLVSCNQWTEDYKLSDFQSQSLFSEYLEMVLQYGFVTIFVAAFPLAPVFALVNNVLEMRLDAKKFIKYYRRPVPQRVKSIGVWYNIMAILGRVSVASNAFIIAFSSHFIPKLVYTLRYSPDRSDEGFLNSTLAYFDVSDFQNGAPEDTSFNVTMCRYAEYRNPPDDLHPYKRPIIYWNILAARLAFVVAYQNVVTFFITAVEWMIPDIPKKLNDKIKAEAYRVNQTIINFETQRSLQLKEQSMRKRNRQSALSTDTMYYDANGSIYPDVRSNRSTLYQDVDEEAGDRE